MKKGAEIGKLKEELSTTKVSLNLKSHIFKQKKGNVKYTKKINQLIKESSNFSQIPLMEKKKQKSKRKKSSAKKKLKKKQYTKMLETKIKQLEEEMNFVKNQIELEKINKNFECVLSKIIANELSPDEEETELKFQDNFETGVQRKMLKSHFKKWINNLKTPLVRYFTETSEKKLDFFADGHEGKSVLFENFQKELNINDKKAEKIKQLKPSFDALSQNFKR